MEQVENKSNTIYYTNHFQHWQSIVNLSLTITATGHKKIRVRKLAPRKIYITLLKRKLTQDRFLKQIAYVLWSHVLVASANAGVQMIYPCSSC